MNSDNNLHSGLNCRAGYVDIIRLVKRWIQSLYNTVTTLFGQPAHILVISFYFIGFCHKSRIITTASANYCWPVMNLLSARKTGVLVEKPRSPAAINYGNSNRMKYHTVLGFSDERHDALAACATRDYLNRDCMSNNLVTMPLSLLVQVNNFVEKMALNMAAKTEVTVILQNRKRVQWRCK